MGVSDGVIVRFSWLLEEGQGRRVVNDGVGQYRGKHSIVALTFEVTGPNLVDPRGF